MCSCQANLLLRYSPRSFPTVWGSSTLVRGSGGGGVHFFLCCEFDVDRLASVSFHSPFLKRGFLLG
jgi:hypothetical protein